MTTNQIRMRELSETMTANRNKELETKRHNLETEDDAKKQTKIKDRDVVVKEEKLPYEKAQLATKSASNVAKTYKDVQEGRLAPVKALSGFIKLKK